MGSDDTLYSVYGMMKTRVCISNRDNLSPAERHRLAVLVRPHRRPRHPLHRSSSRPHLPPRTISKIISHNPFQHGQPSRRQITSTTWNGSTILVRKVPYNHWRHHHLHPMGLAFPTARTRRHLSVVRSITFRAPLSRVPRMSRHHHGLAASSHSTAAKSGQT